MKYEILLLVRFRGQECPRHILGPLPSYARLDSRGGCL